MGLQSLLIIMLWQCKREHAAMAGRTNVELMQSGRSELTQ